MSIIVQSSDTLNLTHEISNKTIPSWVPKPMVMYLAHTECGVPIRRLAEMFKVHPSTVSRSVKKVGSRRRDPLLEQSMKYFTQVTKPTPDMTEGDSPMNIQTSPSTQTSQTVDETEILGVLRQLDQPATVLALAKGLEMAVVVRETADHRMEKLAALSRTNVMAMTMKDWIICEDPTSKIMRYQISTCGRLKLRQLNEEQRFENVQYSETSSPKSNGERSRISRMRYGSVESPLLAMARRKTKAGVNFLDKDLVAAGEQLREDYEIALINYPQGTNWTEVIATGQLPDTVEDAASLRVLHALIDLGPGLGDVVYYCCCKLIGLEVVEKKMGWSARSGKIVMRIALQRLRRHYRDCGEKDRLIG